MQKPVQAQQKPLQPQKVFEFETYISDSVQNRITELAQDRRLVLPPNYSVGNALASAWLILQSVKDRNGQPALKVCTRSPSQCLLDMAIMGHNPAKTRVLYRLRRPADLVSVLLRQMCLA